MTDIRARLVELIMPKGVFISTDEYGEGYKACAGQVLANIERLASEAKVIYGLNFGLSEETDWRESKELYEKQAKYSAILLDIQPLSRKVRVSEIVEMFELWERTCRNPFFGFDMKKFEEFFARLKKEGVEHE